LARAQPRCADIQDLIKKATTADCLGSAPDRLFSGCERRETSKCAAEEDLYFVDKIAYIYILDAFSSQVICGTERLQVLETIET
jgi:hypothetical protein